LKIFFPNGQLEPRQNEDPPLPLPCGSETILVAEDNEFVRLMVTTALELHGYTVIGAMNGEEALSKFSEHSPEIRLALIDNGMPRLSGIEVANSIKKDMPSAQLILMTGYAVAEHAFSANKELAAVIEKPYSLPSLLGLIRSLLDAQEMQDLD